MKVDIDHIVSPLMRVLRKLPKCSWQFINRKRNSNYLPNVLKFNEDEYSNPLDISETFSLFSQLLYKISLIMICKSLSFVRLSDPSLCQTPTFFPTSLCRLLTLRPTYSSVLTNIHVLRLTMFRNSLTALKIRLLEPRQIVDFFLVN